MVTDTLGPPTAERPLEDNEYPLRIQRAFLRILGFDDMCVSACVCVHYLFARPERKLRMCSALKGACVGVWAAFIVSQAQCHCSRLHGFLHARPPRPLTEPTSFKRSFGTMLTSSSSERVRMN